MQPFWIMICLSLRLGNQSLESQRYSIWWYRGIMGNPIPQFQKHHLYWSPRCGFTPTKKTAWILSPWTCAVLKTATRRMTEPVFFFRIMKGCHWEPDAVSMGGMVVSEKMNWGTLFSEKRRCSHLRVYDGILFTEKNRHPRKPAMVNLAAGNTQLPPEFQPLTGWWYLGEWSSIHNLVNSWTVCSLHLLAFFSLT